MLCSKCAKEMADDAKFCPNCGELPDKRADIRESPAASPAPSFESFAPSYESPAPSLANEPGETGASARQAANAAADGARRLFVILSKSITVRTLGTVIILVSLWIGYTGLSHYSLLPGLILLAACGVGAYLLDRPRPVYISRNHVFHFSRKCGGGAFNVTVSNAQRSRQNGLKPCPQCVKFGGFKRLAYKLLRSAMGLALMALLIILLADAMIDSGTGFFEKLLTFFIITVVGGSIAGSVSGEFYITEILKAYMSRLLGRRVRMFDNRKVWIRLGTLKYHDSKTCAGGRPKRIHIREAIDLGYEACGNCGH